MSMVYGDILKGKGSVEAAVNSIGNAVSRLMSLAGVAGIGGLLLMASRDIVQFEDNMIMARAHARLLGKEGEEQFHAMERAARKLGATTRYTSAQAAEAMDMLVLGGLNAQEAIGSLSTVLNLGASAGLGLAESAKIVVDNMVKFGMEAKDTGMIADFLASAQTRAQITARDLAAGLQSLGSTASILGVEFREVVTILTAAGKAGTDMGSAGTALSIGLTRLARQPRETMEAMERLGIVMKDFQKPGGGIDLVKLFRAISDALPTDPVKRLADVTRLFGARGRALGGVFEVMRRGNFVEETYIGLQEDLGRAEAVAEARMHSFSGILLRLRSALGEFFIAGLTPVVKGMEPFIGVLTRSALWISKVSEEWHRLFLESTKSPVRNMIKNWYQFISVGLLLTTVIIGVNKALSGLFVMYALITSPLGLFVASMGLLTAAFIQVVGEGNTFSEKLEDVFVNKIPSYVEDAKFAFRNFANVAQLSIVNLVQGALEMFPEMEKPIENAAAVFAGAWDAAHVFFVNVMNSMKENLKQLRSYALALWEGMKAGWEVFEAGGGYDKIKKAFDKAFNKATLEVGINIPDLTAGMDKAFDKTRKSILEMFEKKGGLGDMLERRRKQLEDAIVQDEEERKAKEEMAQALEGFKSSFNKLLDDLFAEKVGAEEGGGEEKEGIAGRGLFEAGRFGFMEYSKSVQDAILKEKDTQLEVAKKALEENKLQTVVQGKMNDGIQKVGEWIARNPIISGLLIP
ncbi:MAG: phage tail tape measure protein [bacterium]